MRYQVFTRHINSPEWTYNSTWKDSRLAQDRARSIEESSIYFNSVIIAEVRPRPDDIFPPPDASGIEVREHTEHADIVAFWREWFARCHNRSI